jgi:hypothetical protein
MLMAQSTQSEEMLSADAILTGSSYAEEDGASDYLIYGNDCIDEQLMTDIPDFVITSADSARLYLSVDSVEGEKIVGKKERWIPDPKKALWLSIVFPGGGQIYNRKYWKLPIVYGGFLGCVYALNWNNTMYRDYSQAYVDIMDDNPNTKSYENFIPRGYDINQNLTRIQDMFKRKKNFYRRYRDLSIFCMIGVYALSILDAYVDAELSSFDISQDLTMKVKPAVINDRKGMVSAGNMMNSSYGLQCSLSF